MLLFHRDLGGAGRPPLVVLHGLLGSSRNWQTAGRELAERYHVLALDLRNHGSSPHAAEMTFAAMADDVLAWLDAQGIERAVLMGHSMGGKVAMRIACRHAARVERLIAVDVAPRDYESPSLRRQLAAMQALPLAELRNRTDAEARLEAAVPDWALRKFLATNLAQDESGQWRWAVNLPVLAAELGALGKDSLRPDDRFEGPTLVIAGGKSRFVLPEDLPAIARHFPASRVETIPEAGHNPHMETRAALVRLVLAHDGAGA
ncbi:MAG: alpha/beta fold hydrolase [Opitutae bacterium]|nr:alpha/beta fold hydrolase [Opitutae bacterium]